MKAVGKLDEIKKYINIGEENELLERELDQSYLDNLLKKYEPIIKSSKDNSEQEAINTLTQSILGLTGSPMPNCMSMTSLVNKMHKKATAIMTRKIKGKVRTPSLGLSNSLLGSDLLKRRWKKNRDVASIWVQEEKVQMEDEDDEIEIKEQEQYKVTNKIAKNSGTK